MRSENISFKISVWHEIPNIISYQKSISFFFIYFLQKNQISQRTNTICIVTVYSMSATKNVYQ